MKEFNISKEGVKPFAYKAHHALIDAVFETKGGELTSSPDGSIYGWSSIGDLEDWRLKLQNSIGWGKGHKEHHDKLAKHIQPKRVVTLGVGKDATLVGNLLDAYPDAVIYGVDIDPDKIDGAKQTLEKSRTSDDNQRVKLVTGDIAVVLPQIADEVGGLDLVDAQLLLIHLPEREPVFWEKDKMGEFTTLGRVIESVDSSLNRGGNFSVSDLPMVQWTAKAKPGYENNPETREGVTKINNFIHGDNDSFPGALTLGWRVRGANPWSNIDKELVGKVEGYSQDNLTLRRGSEWKTSIQIPDTEGNAAEATLLSYMAPTIPLAANNALAIHRRMLPLVGDPQKRSATETAIGRLEGATAKLWEAGRKYVEGAQTEGVLSVSPPLEFRVFQKR